MLLKKLALIGGCCSIIFAAQSTFASSYISQDCKSDVQQIQTEIKDSKTFKTTGCPAGITSIDDDKTTTIVDKQLCEATCHNDSDELACNWQPGDTSSLACPPAPQ